MAKSVRKTKKTVISREKMKKNSKSRSRASEKVDNLIELHKLQGALLTQLRKDI